MLRRQTFDERQMNGGAPLYCAQAGRPRHPCGAPQRITAYYTRPGLPSLQPSKFGVLRTAAVYGVLRTAGKTSDQPS